VSAASANAAASAAVHLRRMYPALSQLRRRAATPVSGEPRYTRCVSLR
jgi:hypothetical protein